MPAVRKAAIRELAAAAYELDAKVVEGELRRTPQGEWSVGETPLSDWLQAFAGQRVYLILASLEDERPLPAKVCRTCGTEYMGTECPRCREARIRLRGSKTP
ncbi:MAG: hypothetical protein RMK65_02320 [Anaerolineae bacterium]|nr:hypothetical protein [Anaerolineae bacterium]MCX8066351.1 hypothetical protein [Anaerolineae bacterium]MDW7990977.1 hypothetical protein [Anaerolineae bacterium]